MWNLKFRSSETKRLWGPNRNTENRSSTSQHKLNFLFHIPPMLLCNPERGGRTKSFIILCRTKQICFVWESRNVTSEQFFGTIKCQFPANTLIFHLCICITLKSADTHRNPHPPNPFPRLRAHWLVLAPETRAVPLQEQLGDFQQAKQITSSHPLTNNAAPGR